MKFQNAEKMRKSTILKLLGHENSELIMKLHWLDRMSASGNLKDYNFCKKAIENLPKENSRPTLPPPLVNGNDLIKIGYKQNKALGEILVEIQDLQLNDEMKTKQEAIEYAKSKL